MVYLHAYRAQQCLAIYSCMVLIASIHLPTAAVVPAKLSYLPPHHSSHLSIYPIYFQQERTGAEPEEGSTAVGTSAVQQVEEAFGVPVVSVVGLSHLTEYLAAKGDSVGANAEV